MFLDVQFFFCGMVSRFRMHIFRGWLSDGPSAYLQSWNPVPSRPVPGIIPGTGWVFSNGIFEKTRAHTGFFKNTVEAILFRSFCPLIVCPPLPSFLFVFLSVFLLFFLSVFLSVFLFFYVFLSSFLSLCFSFFLFYIVPFFFSFRFSFFLSFCPSSFLSFFLSLSFFLVFFLSILPFFAFLCFFVFLFLLSLSHCHCHFFFLSFLFYLSFYISLSSASLPFCFHSIGSSSASELSLLSSSFLLTSFSFNCQYVLGTSYWIICWAVSPFDSDVRLGNINALKKTSFSILTVI